MDLSLLHESGRSVDVPASTERKLLLLICLLGLGLRIWSVVHVPLEPVFDFKRYLDAATALVVEGQLANLGHPYVIQGPAYPFLLGTFFHVFGIGVLQGKVLNILLSFAAVLLMPGIAAACGASSRLRLLMVGVMAFHPGLILYVNVLGTESLSVFLVTACVWAALRKGRWWLVVLGILLAALSLTRPQFLPVAFLFVFFLGGGLRSIFERILLCLLTFVLAMAPWSIRNYRVFGEFIPVSASAGYVSMVNNNDKADGRWMPLSEVPLSDADKQRFRTDGATSFFVAGNEGEKVVRWPPYNDKIASSVARDWIKTHPREFAVLASKRLEIAFYSNSGDMLFWPLRDVGGSGVLFQVVRAFDLLLFAAAAAGMWVMLWRRGFYWRAGLMPALIVLGGVGAIAMFEGQGRYVLPMVPAALVLASLSLARDSSCTDPVLPRSAA